MFSSHSVGSVILNQFFGPLEALCSITTIFTVTCRCILWWISRVNPSRALGAEAKAPTECSQCLCVAHVIPAVLKPLWAVERTLVPFACCPSGYGSYCLMLALRPGASYKSPCCSGAT